MGLTEKVPDTSTLSQNRIRRFNDSDVFQQIFDHIVEQALSQGMANGRVLYTDSMHLKANANPRKAVNEQRPEGVSEYFAELNAAVESDRKQHESEHHRPGKRVHAPGGQAEGVLLAGPPYRGRETRHHHRYLRDAGQRA